MVAAQRIFEGALPLAGMQRLKGALADTEGSARVEVEFGQDALRIPFVELRIDARMPVMTIEPWLALMSSAVVEGSVVAAGC